jgi:type VI secretion system protein ImpG
LAITLPPGSLKEPSFDTPSGVTFRDITRMLGPLPPILDGRSAWQLVSLIATSYLSIANVDNLRVLLRLMDFRSAHDKASSILLKKRLTGIVSVKVSPDDHLVRGRAVRGRAIEIAIDEHQFGSSADVHLFGSVLDVVLSMFSSINSHTRLKILARDSREEFEWKPRHGTQILQ